MCRCRPMCGHDCSADLVLGAWAAEDLAQFCGVDIRKALDPLDSDDYLVIVSRLGKALQGAARVDEAAALKAAVGVLDVDWVGMSEAARDRVVLAAREAVRGALPGLLPKAGKVLTVSAEKITANTRSQTVRRFALDISASLGREDARTALWLRETNLAFVTDEYRLRSEIASQRAREIVAQGLGQGLGSKDIARTLREELSEGLKGRSKAYWDTIANVFANQARTQTQIFAFAEAGIEQWRWSAALTERSCDVCRFLDGKLFSVEVSAEQFRAQRKLKDPDQIREAQPWLRASLREDGSKYLWFAQGGERHHVADVEESAEGTKDAVGRYTHSIDDKVLQSSGVTCPAHGRCRCELTAVV